MNQIDDVLNQSQAKRPPKPKRNVVIGKKPVSNPLASKKKDKFIDELCKYFSNDDVVLAAMEKSNSQSTYRVSIIIDKHIRTGTINEQEKKELIKFIGGS